MRTDTYKLEAEECRQAARAYNGRPEGDFLLRLATMFEELAHESVPGSSRPPLVGVSPTSLG
jgi:hypothetical protein